MSFFKAMFDELSKLGEVSDEQAEAALDRLDTLERQKPTMGQVARYSAIGAAGGVGVGAIRNGISGTKGGWRGALGNGIAGAISAGAIPVVQKHLDRKAEERTIKNYLEENDKTASTVSVVKPPTLPAKPPAAPRSTVPPAKPDLPPPQPHNSLSTAAPINGSVTAPSKGAIGEPLAGFKPPPQQTVAPTEPIKLAFSTNSFSGPMNPGYNSTASRQQPGYMPRADKGGSPVSGGGFSPTRGGFLLASGVQGPLGLTAKGAAAKPKSKEKDSEALDQGYYPYGPGDFKKAKLASRLASFLRSAPVEELTPAVHKMIGTAPTTYFKDTRLNKGLKALRSGMEPDRENLVKAMRSRLKGGMPKHMLEDARDVDKDALRSFPERLKSPLRTVEHEGVLEELEQAVKHGPNHSADGYTPGLGGRMDPAGMFVHRVGDPIEKERAGAYAASRASFAGGTPARLTFQVPEGLLQNKGRIGGGEYVVPGSLWRHTTGHEIKKLAFKLQGHTTHQGLSIAIENRRGSVRSGTTEDGKKWRTEMKHPYGYIKGSKGADGEEVDCYVGPVKDAPVAHVVHQHKPDGKGYDEDKVMLGFASKKDAREAYLKHYDDPKFLGPMKSVPIERLKALIESGKKLIKISGALPGAKFKTPNVLGGTARSIEQIAKPLGFGRKGAVAGTLKDGNI